MRCVHYFINVLLQYNIVIRLLQNIALVALVVDAVCSIVPARTVKTESIEAAETDHAEAIAKWGGKKSGVSAYIDVNILRFYF